MSTVSYILKDKFIYCMKLCEFISEKSKYNALKW